MTITLHNSLSRKKEVFQPISEDSVGMYVCGPTVYDRAHLGNARAMVIFDTLYRTLSHLYGKDHVRYVRNITDVDDKINAASQARGVPIQTITDETTRMFHEDMASLGCLPPVVEPRATTHIPQMIAMIQTLITGQHAYAAEGHVLFRVSSDKKYGHLSGRSVEEMIAGARVEVAPFKENPADFVLWKPSSENEPGWDSPWGRGRPGWHIECSAMSTKYLGTTFDIHGGGADLQFPHHENEIAQSTCANPKSHYAKYWVHNGFLTVEGEKMSKSLGNFTTVHDVLADGVQGEAIRYTLLATHYRKPLDWTTKALSDATLALDGFYRLLQQHPTLPEAVAPTNFLEALYDDVNTPLAFSVLHTLANRAKKADKDQPALLAQLKCAANLIGLLTQSPESWFAAKTSGDDAPAIQALVDARVAAKKAKNWPEADRLRAQLTALNIMIKDNPDGTTNWEKK